MHGGFENGFLKAIKPATRDGRLWLCYCSCGRYIEVSRWHLERRKRSSCGKCKQRIRRALLECRICQITKPRSEFPQKKNGQIYHAVCVGCYKPRLKLLRLQTKHLVMRTYCSGTPHCMLCGDEHFEFLCIDHIDGRGEDLSSLALYRWLLKAGCPDGYRVLCMNCNQEDSINRQPPTQVIKQIPNLPILEGKPRHRQCRWCGDLKPLRKFPFYTGKKDGHYRRWSCDACTAIILRVRHNKIVAKRRIEVLKHYSGGIMKCSCCGCSNLKHLSFDHIGGGGNKHRKAIKTNSVFRWLKANNYPSKIQIRVLCHNCNHSFGCFGYCPHQSPKMEIS